MVTQLATDLDHFQDECGVFAIYGRVEAAALATLGLHALQHRGQEAAGIVSFDGQHFYSHKAAGFVGDKFSDPKVIKNLKGHAAIGHTRYATTGESMLRNVQPLFADLKFGGIAIAHNGNLTNGLHLRSRLVEKGCLFQSTTDTEVIIHLIARSKEKALRDKIIDAVSQVEGAYSLIGLSDDCIVGMRDPYGVRPLVLGECAGAYVLASETCALDIIDATFIRDIEPGELVIINEKGITSSKPLNKRMQRFCIFEYVYFSRPDSIVEGRGVYEVRKKIGEELAREHPTPADLVVPVPDSGVPSAIGYANAAGLPFDHGIIRNHYVGRTFIEPTDNIRHLGVRLKHNANRAVLEGKRVILVDDSIVRGTTSTKIVNMVRAAGATEVHMRIASPPTTHSCYYGVDTPERSKLLAASKSVEEMAQLIGVDSLAFLSIDGMYKALGKKKRSSKKPQFCDACFTGDYPITLRDHKKGLNLRELSAMQVTDE